jgi:hypothetical protein
MIQVEKKISKIATNYLLTHFVAFLRYQKRLFNNSCFIIKIGRDKCHFFCLS